MILKKVLCFSSIKHVKKSFFESYILNTNLCKKGKLSCEHRISMKDILTKYCNVIVSHSDNCELNYVYLECLHYGIPLIHNSKYLKDYGYYYPDFDINKTSSYIKDILDNFNREEYIEKNKSILYKYSMYNQENIDWINDRIIKNSF